MHEASSPTDEAQGPGRRAQKGSIIVYLVVALVAFGVLALAGMTRFGSTVMGVFSPNCATSARLMAESGVRYAMARMRACATAADLNTAITAMNGTSYDVDVAKGLSFSLSIGYNASTYVATVTATGRGCTLLTPVNAAAASGSVNLPIIAAAGGGTPPTPSPGTALSFASNIAGFNATAGFNNKDGVTIDTTAKTIALGNEKYENSASVWYVGSNDVCTSGNCTLGNGLCAYWEFQFNADSTGDGYVWTLMSGDTNTKNSNGGDTGHGELMGYGGLGSSGLGIQPPKLGVEFDIYDNSENNNVCTLSACDVGSRCDYRLPNNGGAPDHVAFVFWGTESVTGCSATFDDNRHGSGADTTAQPKNAYNSITNSGSDGYYYRASGGGSNSWMKTGGKFFYRYELDRATVADTAGTYCYRIRSWLKKTGDSGLTGMSNCQGTYTATPAMTKIFTLNSAMHQKLDKVFFGWTEGTGGATQLVTLSDFNLDFKSAPAVPVAPSDYSAAWAFSESSGSSAADRKGVCTGTLSGTYSHGSPGRDCGLPGVACPNSGYIDFSGGNGRMTVNDNGNIDLTSSGTIAAWININNYDNNAGLVHKGNRSDWKDEAYSLQFTSSRKVGLYITSTNGAQNQLLETVANALPNNDQWYHVAASWSPSIIKIYINGTLNNFKNNSSPNITAQNSTGPLIIGAQLPNSEEFNGIIDEVYLYKRALTDAEIAGMALGHP